ncbi:MAG: hypothetical protein IAB19_03300 [Proteobacteria bacterium]|uniref:Glycine zipper 2TM domain-containing protein n=1 Tax=Candidatus Avisuccinivibrio stercorigallinarum TaxID=2840704 RepID=A0A9D9DBL4_9GAMM|nr:hypothetical protein [Candidatus Avisuccinivibrio stercorigallinarum]
MFNFSKTKASISAAVISLTFGLTACTNPTGSAGQSMYFTEGVITSVEVIDNMQKNRYDATSTAVLGGVGGAAAGQIIGHDTKSTIIGAGIGAVIAGLSAKIADQGEGMRVTVKTEQGQLLIDQPYSCLLQPGRKVRMINNNGSYQLQVFDGSTYRTAEQQSPSECNF